MPPVRRRVVNGEEASRIFWQLGCALSSDGLHFSNRQLLEFTNPVQVKASCLHVAVLGLCSFQLQTVCLHNVGSTSNLLDSCCCPLAPASSKSPSWDKPAGALCNGFVACSCLIRVWSLQQQILCNSLFPMVQIPEEAWGRRGGMIMQNPYDGPQFLLFYTMIGTQIINFMGKWAIGLATSDDGLQWTRLGDKPIIEGEAA